MRSGRSGTRAEGIAELPPWSRATPAPASRSERARRRRRAVEHARSCSTTARPQGLPTARAGHQSRARDARFLTAHGFATSQPSRAGYTYAGELARRDARGHPGVGARRARRLGPRAGCAAQGTARFARPAAASSARVTGRMHAALAGDRPTRLRPEKPTDENVALLTATVDEEIARLFLAPPRGRVGADPRPRRGAARPAAAADAHGASGVRRGFQ